MTDICKKCGSNIDEDSVDDNFGCCPECYAPVDD